MANSFDLTAAMAAANSDEFDASSIFQRNPVSGNIAAEKKEEIKPPPQEEEVITKKTKDVWVPDQDVLDSVPDATKASGVVYNSDEVQLSIDTSVKNISDEIVQKAGSVELTEMERIAYNVREACFRNNIKELHIPDMCPERLAIINIAAGKIKSEVDPALDKALTDIMQLHPEWIIQKFDEGEVSTDSQGIINPGKPSEDGIDQKYTSDDVTLVLTIDKSQVDQLNFTEDELEKIKKSHVIELNIKEKGTINFSSLEKAPDDDLDRILNTYKPQVNGLQIVLPASRYRCTVSGLSYPDLMEISSDREINDQDAVRSIWSVCFKHIHNPSIGPFEAYTTYIDKTGETHKIKPTEEVPEDAINVHEVTEYEDFMNKTSYLDQGFILWNILCLTASDSELVTAVCLNEKCKKRIEFSYNPDEILDKSSISPAVETEMERTRLASSEEEIMNWYNDGLLRSHMVVELPDSKIKLQYGHVSARTYVEDLYNDMQEAEAMLNQIREGKISDRSLFGRLNTKLFLQAIISFIIPDPDKPERLYRIDSISGKLKVLDSLSFRDWAVVDEISTLVISPYRFRYILKGKRCPNCGTLNNFDLGGVEGLLFLIDDLRAGTKISLTT